MAKTDQIWMNHCLVYIVHVESSDFTILSMSWKRVTIFLNNTLYISCQPNCSNFTGVCPRHIIPRLRCFFLDIHRKINSNWNMNLQPHKLSDVKAPIFAVPMSENVWKCLFSKLFLMFLWPSQSDTHSVEYKTTKCHWMMREKRWTRLFPKSPT